MAGTIEINGTGGILEGNLTGANVNVNLDAALEFDGANDLISVGNIGTHAQWTVSCWVKKTGFSIGGGENNIWDGNDGSTVYPYLTMANNYIYCYFEGGNTNTNVAGDWETEWNHIAVTYDAEATNNMKVYLNGVLKSTSDANNTSQPTTFTDFTIGDGSNYGKWDGFMADVKTFNDDLAIEDIQILASKINVDPVLVSKTANLTGWWKITDAGSTINDFVNETNGGTDHNGTLTGGDWRYNQYSVNVQDNTTQTNQAVTVTQGKLECLSLSCVDFNASDSDHITTGATLQTTFDGSFTVSAWIKPDNGQPAAAREILGSKNTAAEDYVEFYIGTDGKLNFYYESNNQGKTAQTASAVWASGAAAWTHVAATIDDTANQTTLYVNGVAQTLDGTENGDLSGLTNANWASVDELFIGARDFHGTADTFFDGAMRDVKIFDYALSADQASSLYSGSYNVTPQHWWKMDDDTGATGAIEDYGTGTDNDGTGVSLTWVNGTLDLDSTLTIAANGTFNGPRGTLQIDDDITGAGTFTLLTGSTFTLASGKTFTGTSTASQLTVDIPDDLDLEIVADVANLDCKSGTDMTVVGAVSGCTFEDSTANIRQWHHTLDTQQLLDADEAGDDDLRLTTPALDNAHEVMTG